MFKQKKIPTPVELKKYYFFQVTSVVLVNDSKAQCVINKEKCVTTTPPALYPGHYKTIWTLICRNIFYLHLEDPRSDNLDSGLQMNIRSTKQ